MQAVEQIADQPRPNNVKVLLACMPKSGSTFLAEIISELPGMRRTNVVPGHKRREQEICLEALQRAELETRILRRLWRRNQLAENSKRPRGYVTQIHVRYTEPTAEIIERHNLLPVVLVRNLFDTVISIRDHYRNSAVYMSMAYVNEEMRDWPDDKLHEFIADMVMPWYINFYVCWNDCPNKLFVTYDDLKHDIDKTVKSIVDYTGLNSNTHQISAAIERAQGANTRKNKAVSGRGDTLSKAVKDKIRGYANYYPHIDFSPLGL